jgi:hypothetical protein
MKEGNCQLPIGFTTENQSQPIVNQQSAINNRQWIDLHYTRKLDKSA